MSPTSGVYCFILVSICHVCILKRRSDLKRSHLSIISSPLHQRCFYHPFLFYLHSSPFPSLPLFPSCHLCLFGPCGLRLKTNEATNMWKDRNLLALSSCVNLLFFAVWATFSTTIWQKQRLPKELLCATRGCASRPISHQYPLPPHLLYFYLFLSFRAMALGQVHLQGVWIEMHWSLAHWKLFPLLFLFFYKSNSP